MPHFQTHIQSEPTRNRNEIFTTDNSFFRSFGFLLYFFVLSFHCEEDKLDRGRLRVSVTCRSGKSFEAHKTTQAN